MSARSVVVAAALSLAVLSVAGTASASDPAPWPTQGFGWQSQGGVGIGLGGVPVWTAGLDEARDGLSVAIDERASQRGSWLTPGGVCAEGCSLIDQVQAQAQAQLAAARMLDSWLMANGHPCQRGDARTV
jgi:hypothetical protein